MLNRAIGKTLTSVLKSVEAKLEGVKKQFLINLAEDIVAMSPVDTGQYVSSHHISETPMSGRFTGKIVRGIPKALDVSAKKETALSTLLSEIENLPPDSYKIYINNVAPHARIVEFGGPNWRRDGYYIYSTVENKSNIYLAEAIAKVKGSP